MHNFTNIYFSREQKTFHDSFNFLETHLQSIFSLLPLLSHDAIKTLQQGRRKTKLNYYSCYNIISEHIFTISLTLDPGSPGGPVGPASPSSPKGPRRPLSPCLPGGPGGPCTQTQQDVELIQRSDQ